MRWHSFGKMKTNLNRETAGTVKSLARVNVGLQHALLVIDEVDPRPLVDGPSRASTSKPGRRLAHAHDLVAGRLKNGVDHRDAGDDFTDLAVEVGQHTELVRIAQWLLEHVGSPAGRRGRIPSSSGVGGARRESQYDGVGGDDEVGRILWVVRLLDLV
jgi:hypothetical protein